jgi:tRNA threonylcarbamoyladenosine biosynthesis protein TsaE
MYVTEEQLPKVARALVAYLIENAPSSGAVVVALSGDLGAGKTALVQQIAAALCVAQVPPSPTFVIMRKYETQKAPFSKLVHIDAYRIEDEAELPPLHLREVFAEKGTVVCVEWPEKLGSALPKGAIRIALKTVDENTREMLATGEVARALQKSLQVV